MITMDNEKFEGNEFALQVIAKGSFIDNGTGSSKSYVIETTTLRLNHVALNAWYDSHTYNCRDCYETDEEWEAHKAEYEKRHKAVKAQFIDTLGIDVNKGSISITQSQSEVFTVVHIYEAPLETA